MGEKKKKTKEFFCFFCKFMRKLSLSFLSLSLSVHQNIIFINGLMVLKLWSIYIYIYIYIYSINPKGKCGWPTSYFHLVGHMFRGLGLKFPFLPCQLYQRGKHSDCVWSGAKAWKCVNDRSATDLDIYRVPMEQARVSKNCGWADHIMWTRVEEWWNTSLVHIMSWYIYRHIYVVFSLYQIPKLGLVLWVLWHDPGTPRETKFVPTSLTHLKPQRTSLTKL